LCWNDLGGRWNLRPAALGGNPFFLGEVEPCINGGVLALGASFGRPNESLANRLVDDQLEDGGWNCEAPKSVRSSFNTTICVLEGVLEYEPRRWSCAVHGGGQTARRGVLAQSWALPTTLHW